MVVSDYHTLLVSSRLHHHKATILLKPNNASMWGVGTILGTTPAAHLFLAGHPTQGRLEAEKSGQAGGGTEGGIAVRCYCRDDYSGVRLRIAELVAMNRLAN